jgi:hypothetical protein
MSQPKPITDFRAAIRSGNYAAADQLLNEVQHEVEQRWRSAGPEERRSLAAETFDLLSWARTAVMCGRAQSQRKLADISRHSAYLKNTGQLELER